MLVPEQRQHDRRPPEVQRLGDRVVAAVGDHQVDLGEERGLGQELGTGHVAGELVLGVLGSLGDDVAVWRGAEDVHQALHQRDVAGAERPEAEVDQRPVAVGELGRHRP